MQDRTKIRRRSPRYQAGLRAGMAGRPREHIKKDINFLAGYAEGQLNWHEFMTTPGDHINQKPENLPKPVLVRGGLIDDTWLNRFVDKKLSRAKPSLAHEDESSRFKEDFAYPGYTLCVAAAAGG